MKFRRSGKQSRLIRTLGIQLWGALTVACDSQVQPAGGGPDTRIWRVDHHMHLASAEFWPLMQGTSDRTGHRT
jgi:hypothetical protein